MSKNIPTLTTGQKSTVGNWVKLASVVFGKDSKQVEFLRSKATKENGFDEPIISDERQLLFMLMNMDAHYCEIANERIQKAIQDKPTSGKNL